MKKQIVIIFNLIFLILMCYFQPLYAEEGFTQKDREVLIKLQTKMEEIDKRFEQVDRRFAELREDMNKRFEQVDKRFEQLMDFLYILTGIFATLVAVVIGFAYWDRRTILYKAREEAREMTQDDRNTVKHLQVRLDLIQAALRRMAVNLPEVKKILAEMHLL